MMQRAEQNRPDARGRHILRHELNTLPGEALKHNSCDGRADPSGAAVPVSGKTGVVELARSLAALGVRLLSTGGTARRSGTPVSR